MQVKNIINTIAYTNKNLSESISISENTIKKIKSGKIRGSEETRNKILDCVLQKVEKVIELTDKDTL